MESSKENCKLEFNFQSPVLQETEPVQNFVIINLNTSTQFKLEKKHSKPIYYLTQKERTPLRNQGRKKQKYANTLKTFACHSLTVFEKRHKTFVNSIQQH